MDKGQKLTGDGFFGRTLLLGRSESFRESLSSSKVGSRTLRLLF